MAEINMSALNESESTCNFTEFQELEHKAAIEGASKSILFIFTATLVGAFIRQILKKYNVPYTVVLFLVGAAIGLINMQYVIIKKYTMISDIDPSILLQLFLPVLIFESAFGMEAHMFFKAILQCIILAIPGLIFCTVLTAAFAKYVLYVYQWDWLTAFIFGSILSATDPVAVVALLKECGISPTLTTIIEGESLLNDGSAIVIFEVLTHVLETQGPIYIGSVTIDFFKTCLGAPLLGYLVARISTWFLSHVYNDSVVEITITFSVAYLTYYIAEKICYISGVLAVVILGVVMSSNKSSISPEIEKSVHHFWEMLGYIANTLIFIIVGIIITEKAANTLNSTDTLLVFATYFAVTVFRLLMLAVFRPILRRIGYGMTWKHVIVLTWGGLRGAVGLALALMLRNIDIELNEQKFADGVLIQVSGIIVLTLVFNGSTMNFLLEFLGMRKISPTHHLAMVHAVTHLKDVATRSIRVQSMDKFMSGANWLWVTERTRLDDPYENMGELNEAMCSFFLPVRHGACNDCSTNVAVETTEEELDEIKEVSRLRVLKALKASLWKQYEHGMVTRSTVQALIPAVDDTTDIPEKYLTTKEIRKRFMKPSSWYIRSEKYLSQLLKKIPPHPIPDEEISYLRELSHRTNCLRSWCIRVYLNKYFETFVFLILLINVITIAYEVSLVYSKMNRNKADEILAWDIVNMFFVALYLAEAAIKIYATGIPKYVEHKWNRFALAVAFISLLEIIVDIIIFYVSREKYTYVAFLQFLIICRLFRVVRALNRIVHYMLKSVRNQIASQMYHIYDIGHGFICANEEITKNIAFLVDYGPCESAPLTVSTQNIMEMVTFIDELEQTDPGIAIALKSHRAARHVLNDMKKALDELHQDGLAEESETQVLEAILDEMVQVVITSPKTLPANVDVESVLERVDWVTSDRIFQLVMDKFVIRNYKAGQLIHEIGADPDGISIVSSGIVKITGKNKSEPSSALPNTDSLMYFEKEGRFFDYLGTSCSIGLLGFLVQSPFVTSCICEKDAQLIYISEDALSYAERKLNDELFFAMWRPIALKIAAMILADQSGYLGWEKEDIKLRLEKSVLPNFNGVEKFLVDPIVEDMVMIQGRCKDVDSGITYVGPAYIPSTVRHLNLVDDPESRHRVIMVLLVNDKYGQDNLEFVELEDIGVDDLCLKHGAKRISRMIEEGKLPPRKSSVAASSSSSIRKRISSAFRKESRELLTKKSSDSA